MLIYTCIFLAAFNAVIAVYFFINARKLRSILMKGAKQYDEQQKELNFVKGRLSAAEAMNIALEKDLNQSRTIHQSETGRNAKIVSEFLNVQTNLERKLSNAELQRDHILNRFEALQDERASIDAEFASNTLKIKGLETERDQLGKDLSDSTKKANSKLKSENDDLRRRIHALEKEASEHKAETAVDPKELETLRRRASHNEQLYQSMKSLRDMADERNRNWENALKSLATWILSSSSLSRKNDPVLNQSIGPLVGEALERIGGTLVDEMDEGSEVMAEQQALDLAEP